MAIDARAGLPGELAEKRLLDLVLNSAATLVYIVDPETRRFAYVSRSCQQLLGRTFDELCGPNAEAFDEFFSDPGGGTESVGEATLGRVLRVRHRNGQQRWLHCRELVLDYDESGRVTRVLGIGQDVTDRREVAGDLGLHKDLLRTVMRIVERFAERNSSAQIENIILDAMQWISTRVGARECHLCRIEDRERLPVKVSMVQEWCARGLLSARPGFQHLPVNLFPWFFTEIDNHRQVRLRDLTRLPKSDAVLRAMLHARRASSYLALPLVTGSESWGYVGFVPADDSHIWDDDIIALLRLMGQIFVNRLTDRDMQVELERSQSRWRLTADTAYDLVLLLDPDSNVQEASTKREDFVTDQFIGKSIYSLVDPTSYRSLRTAINVASKAQTLNEGARHIEFQAPGPDTTLQWYRARVGPMIEKQLNVGTTVFAALIQEQKEAESRIQQLNRDLEQASRLSVLGQMATEIAHELNQPLQVISSFAGGLRSRVEQGVDQTEDLLKALDRIGAAADDAARTVNNIRQFVQSKTVDPQIVSVEEIVETALELAEQSVRDNDVVVDCEIGDDLPPLCVNPAQISHVLLNLIQNGIEAALTEMVLEPIAVHIVCRFDDDDDFVRISVTDNGPGVPAGQEEAIFERYFTTKPSGLGVGLASSRDVIQWYGGDLRLAPAPADGGAEFFFQLPRAESEVEGVEG